MPHSSAQHDLSSSATSGRNKPRVKTGCRTCKIRKVKCDQGRPACQRCVSTGRSCEGYGIWGGGSRGSGGLRAHGSAARISGNESLKVGIPRKALRVECEVAESESSESARSHSSDSPQSTQSSISSEQSIIRAARWYPTYRRDTVPTDMVSDPCQIVQTSISWPLVEQQGSPNIRGLLEWFKTYTATKIGGLFPSPFWTHLLPQASYTEPAVLQAVVALASAHKEEQFELVPRRISGGRTTLRAYTEAIRRLRSRMDVRDRASARVTLISCILFVCLEIVQRRHQSAVQHLRSGLKLLETCDKLAVNDRSAGGSVSDDLIGQLFLRLAVQLTMLSQTRIPPAPMSSIQRLPTAATSIFASTLEARTQLDALVARVYEFNALIRKGSVMPSPDQMLLEVQTSLAIDLNNWYMAFTTSELDSPDANPWRRVGCLVLRMSHKMAFIMVSVALLPDREAGFDEYWPEFQSIVAYASLAKAFVETTKPPPSSVPQPQEVRSTIIDIGLIPTLFFAATKCRFRNIREEAISLLEATVHREGLWDPRIATEVAREVVRIEQESELRVDRADAALCLDAFVEELSSAELQSSARLYDVEIVLPDQDGGKFGFKGRIRGTSGWEDVRRQYDTTEGLWVDMPSASV